MLVGIVGWRGMVGQVLLERMSVEKDNQDHDFRFYSTSQVGETTPEIFGESHQLGDALNIKELEECDAIISCQGSSYTASVHPSLRKQGWEGYWIDASSGLRMEESSVIVLDPVNRSAIDQALDSGIKDYIGGNCTVSLMLMALNGLFQQDWVEGLSSMTYQAISGSGAKAMKELVQQMATIGKAAEEMASDPRSSVLDVDSRVLQAMQGNQLPKNSIGFPLCGSLLPWIDSEVEKGQSREEWKGHVETNKILGRGHDAIAVDGTCVRVASMRCHSQALTVKLKKNIPLDEIEDALAEGTAWTEVVPNTKQDTLTHLTPTSVTGALKVPVGRLRKMRLGPNYLNAFTVGDQLLWGAAEPLRRTLKILSER